MSPRIDLTGLKPETIAIAGAGSAVVSSVGMYTALKAVDKSGRSSATASAASQLLEVGSKQRLTAMAALVGGAAVAGSGSVPMSDDQRSAALGIGAGALAAEGVHQGYSMTHWPHGGAFNPQDIEGNIVARYERIGSETPEWQRGAARMLQQVIPR